MTKFSAQCISTAELIAAGALEIGDGYRAKNLELAPIGIPFARVKNLNNGFDFTDADLLPLSAINRVGTKTSCPGDCVLTSKGSVGRVAYVGPDTPRFVYSPQLSYWRSLDLEVIHPQYLRYWLQGPEFVIQRDAVKGSTDMADYVNLRDQRRMTISLPPLSTQRKIAAILSAYDDLIENNNRRIKLLEEMAQRIYREWFVVFRFPGHENIPLVHSELGPIPSGWKVSRLGDAVEFVYGKALKAGARRNGEVTVFGSGGAIGYHDEALAEGPGIVVGRKGNVGSVYWSNGAFFAIDTTYWIRSTLALTYCYYALCDMEFLDSHAAVPGLSREQAYSLPLVVPESKVIAMFDGLALQLFALCGRIADATDNLRITRDLLLPRLISGEVEVTDLDIAIPEAAA